MAIGISLNIGLNQVDPKRYGDYFDELEGCENDARDMRALAAAQGFQTTLMLNNQATSTTVTNKIKDAANQLSGGDFILLTYSGHGAQLINELNEDEESDGLDETWALFDRNLIDDELTVLWSQFRPDVRILVISDSCHSGAFTRPFGSGRRSRGIRRRSQQGRMIQFREIYDAIRRRLPNMRALEIGACVLSLSACEDGQSADDGAENGAFTGALLLIWDNGAFIGDYHRLYQSLLEENLYLQKPQISLTGSSNISFMEQRPFTI